MIAPLKSYILKNARFYCGTFSLKNLFDKLIGYKLTALCARITDNKKEEK